MPRAGQVAMGSQQSWYPSLVSGLQFSSESINKGFHYNCLASWSKFGHPCRLLRLSVVDLLAVGLLAVNVKKICCYHYMVGLIGKCYWSLYKLQFLSIHLSLCAISGLLYSICQHLPITSLSLFPLANLQFRFLHFARLLCLKCTIRMQLL